MKERNNLANKLFIKKLRYRVKYSRNKHITKEEQRKADKILTKHKFCKRCKRCIECGDCEQFGCGFKYPIHSSQLNGTKEGK